MAPNKIHHTIENFIEATKNGINDELKTMRTCKYTNVSKNEQLKPREDIVITNADKRGTVDILNVKDCNEEYETQLNDTEPQISHTSKISEDVDFHPQPIVKQIPSYVKDTTDFLPKLDAIKSVPDNTYLVTLDV